MNLISFQTLTTRGWLLLALSLLGAFTYGVFVRDWVLDDAPDWARVALKTSGVALLVALAASERASAHLIAALAFGALGDALLAIHGQTAFIAGALAFLIGHAIYVMLFLRAGLGLGLLKQPARLALSVALLASAILCATLLVPHDTMALASAAIYTIALTAMVLSSFTLPWTRWLVMLGAVLFFLSDILLTWHANKPPSDPLQLRILSDTSWFTYYFGQAGLCLGALSLRPRS